MRSSGWLVSQLRLGCQCRGRGLDQVVRGRKDAPLADAHAQFIGTVFEGLHVAVTCSGQRTKAASIRAWTARSRRTKSRTAAGRKTTRRITGRTGVGLRPGCHRRPVPHGPDPAWQQSQHRGFPAYPVPLEKKLPPAPDSPEGHPRAIEGGCDRRTCFNYGFEVGIPTSDPNVKGSMSRIDAGICGGAVCAGGLGRNRRFTGLIAARASSMDARTQADLWGLISFARGRNGRDRKLGIRPLLIAHPCGEMLVARHIRRAR
jgi:hypothetical protein